MKPRVSHKKAFGSPRFLQNHNQFAYGNLSIHITTICIGHDTEKFGAYLIIMGKVMRRQSRGFYMLTKPR